jgi:hypothetical protein
MANHVNNNLTFEQISDEGRKVWQEQFVDTIAEGNYSDLRELFFEIGEDNQFIDFDYEVLENKIGAKWATIEDAHEDGMNVCSAWSPIIPFAEHVAKTIGKVDPSIRIVMTYEDEFPNFVGVATFTAEGLDNNTDWDWEEMRDRMIRDCEELRELWDAEEEDWTDEGEAIDIMGEIQWETIHDMQHEGIEWSSK